MMVANETLKDKNVPGTPTAFPDPGGRPVIRNSGKE